MTILKVYKYRLYPTKQQEVLLNKTFGCVRVVWNHNVEVFNNFDKNQPLTTTQLKQKHDWMSEVQRGGIATKRNGF